MSVSGKCPCGPGKQPKPPSVKQEAESPSVKPPSAKHECVAHEDCAAKKMFCRYRLEKHIGNACESCENCHYPDDGVGKTCGPLCTPSKGGTSAAPVPAPPAGGQQRDNEPKKCEKHKDCTKTEFCSTDGCLKCKECKEGEYLHWC